MTAPRSHHRLLLLGSALALPACLTSSGRAGDAFDAGTAGGDADGSESDGSPGSDESNGSGDATGGGQTDGGTNTTGGGSSGGGDTDPGPGIRFDTPDGGPTGGDGGGQGCEKIDFLFVVDNSQSMENEQANLIASFPGFIAAIKDEAMAQDYHIMVVDSDSGPNSCNHWDTDSDCSSYCSMCEARMGCECYCNGVACSPPPTDCRQRLGAGITTTQDGTDCGFTSGGAYMLDSQPDLAQAFECAARVGATGDPAERVMLSALDAIGTLNGPGQCNEGFLRDDAILVVTLITDTDAHTWAGDPQEWVDAMVEAKNGDEAAVVAIGFLGDTDLPNPVCQTPDRQPSPRLRQWAESFTHGQWQSVCTPDYAPFFAEAVSVIDTACDDFIPPG